jgi:hypothetical protein
MKMNIWSGLRMAPDSERQTMRERAGASRAASMPITGAGNQGLQ